MCRLSGICGNYNGIKEDDAVDKDGNPVECGDGRKCKNPLIGNSWEVPSFEVPQGSVCAAGMSLRHQTVSSLLILENILAPVRMHTVNCVHCWMTGRKTQLKL